MCPTDDNQKLVCQHVQGKGSSIFPLHFNMFREKINFPLLCQKLANYFNLKKKYNLDFRGCLYFNTSSHLTFLLFMKQLSDEGERGGKLFGQIHLRIPMVHTHVRSFKPLEVWLV